MTTAADDRMTTRTMYFKIRDKHGKEHVEEHLVWDAEKFYDSITKQHTAEGGSAIPISKDAYQQHRSATRR